MTPPRSSRLRATHALAALLWALLGGASSTARADALAPPPDDCPEGSVGDSSRWGTHCEWRPCGDACPTSARGEQLACSAREIAMCVETASYAAQDVQQGPRMVSMPAETWNVAHGPCAADGICARGRCVRERACVPQGSPAAASGLCSASRRPAGPVAWTTLAALALLTLARGHRRRRS